MFGVFSLISLLVIPGICGQEWKIQYTNMMKCVIKGSKTHLSGTYKHPDRLNVTEIFWTVNPDIYKNTNLLNLPDYSGRVQYFPIKDRTFVLQLSNVRHEDEGMYCIRIVTNEEKERYLFTPGIELKVTELRVEIPEEVVEKDSPVLFCNTTCNLLNTTHFIWYKNGESFSESSVGNRLILQSVSSDDTGNYSCAVRDQKHLPSPAVTLSVRYPPKSVSVWVSGSGVIVEGDSVTLNCSSDSNPPALNFSWFKEDETSAVGSGQSFSISSFNSSFSGRFYCEAQNKYGFLRSASVSLFTVKGGLNTDLYAAAGIGAALIAVCVIVVVIKILRKAGDTGVQVSKQENSSGAVTNQMSTSDSGVQNDLMYASIAHKSPRKPQSAGDEDEVQYATVQHHRNTGNTSVKAEGQSGDVRDRGPADSSRSDDSNVIYSSINVAGR
ncbi:B-cell receptor CD22-like [Siphateles boraxobius]|uniref:B-cell receptor CD22-like n=1 Tax=Siphateles boraxobius TaxID=180520 RepID=UPI004063366C